MEDIRLLIQTLKTQCPQLKLLQGEAMSRHTTFRIGGSVSLMAFPVTEEEVVACVTTAQRAGVRLELVGNGSNLLVADEGLDAFVIHMGGLQSMTLRGEDEITAGAGVSLAHLAIFAAQHNLAGLVFAHGIPGTVGGAVLMNAGAYGGEISQVVVSTRYLTKSGEILTCNGGEHNFSYRHSVFSERDIIILSSTLKLTVGDEAMLTAQMKECATKRRNSQPLEYPSGGSMFKRPEGYFAAALIDQCGLKGFSVGGAQVSEKHAGFVVNRGDATCRDVLALVDEVKKQVYTKFCVVLEMEVKLLR